MRFPLCAASALVLAWAVGSGCGSSPGYDPRTTAGPVALRYAGPNAQGYDEYVRERDGSRMVRVPAGPYARRPYDGSRTLAGEPVGVEGYLIDKYEVTNAQFAAFLNETGTGPTRTIAGTPRPMFNPSPWGMRQARGRWESAEGFERHPVVGATAWSAALYARWAGGELPTDDQWMKAAGGPDGHEFPFEGKPGPFACNSYRAGIFCTVPVGTFRLCVSPIGCHDMAGNVYERVRSPRAQGRPVMIKGGSWATDHPLNLRVPDLCMQPMEASDLTVGFRCVIDGRSLPSLQTPDEKRRMKPLKDEVAGWEASACAAARRGIRPPARLLLARSAAQGLQEARERNCPVLLGFFYDTCGQCDRTRMQVFSDPALVDYLNEWCVTIVGQDPWDGADDPHPEGPAGSCTLWPSLRCEEHERVFHDALPLVGRFEVSPGCFVLDPRAREGDLPEKRILVPEKDLPKNGTGAGLYLEKLQSAQKLLGPSLTRAEWETVHAALDATGKEDPEAAERLRVAIQGKDERIPLVAEAINKLRK